MAAVGRVHGLPVTDHLARLFPGLAGQGFLVTSPHNKGYNCIAWAAGDHSRWWEPAPGYYWPTGLEKYEPPTLGQYIRMFRSLGYEECESRAVEPGFQKIALYASPDGRATHAARMLPSGRWTSKLGRLEDIEHELAGLEGDAYGRVACVMKRRLVHSSEI